MKDKTLIITFMIILNIIAFIICYTDDLGLCVSCFIIILVNILYLANVSLIYLEEYQKNNH